MRPLVRYWRSKALSIVVYLDDGIFAAQSFSKCEEHSLLVRSDLFQSGFVPNKCKCQWVPLEVICWLVLLGEVSQIFWSWVMFASSWLIECRNGWDAQVVLDSDALIELKLWREHLQSLNHRPIWRKHTLPSRVVYSDANAVGCAAFISMNGRAVSHKNWDAIEIKQSSTWRELMCVKHALQSFVHLLKGSLVKWYTDNQGVAGPVVPRFICISWLWKYFYSLRNTMLALILSGFRVQRTKLQTIWAKLLILTTGVLKILIFGLLTPIGGPLQLSVSLIPLMLKLPGFIPCFFQPGCLCVHSLAFDWG